MIAGPLPEGYRRLRVWGPGRCAPGTDLVEARSAEEALAANALGFAAGDVYFTAPRKSGEDIRDVMGKCRIIADSLEELRLIDQAAREISAEGRPEAAGLLLALDGWAGRGVPLPALPALARELRGLSNLSIRGCFVQGNVSGLHGEALGRYFRECYEAAKRMSAVLPCGVGFLCAVGGGEAAERSAEEHPETLPAFRRAAAIVAAQNQSAFYARLIVT
ncbi:MAG: hypothetical protein HDT14_12550 [Oscillibacter sp.]|nr:hypothetical protein [Oscillibacter sp.]